MVSSLGERLLQLRARRGWSQADLAKRLDVAKATIGHLEHGRRYPRYELLVEIARLLDEPVGKLFAETRKPHRDPRAKAA